MRLERALTPKILSVKGVHDVSKRLLHDFCSIDRVTALLQSEHIREIRVVLSD